MREAMAAFLVAMLVFVLPQVHFYAAAQKYSEVLPVLPPPSWVTGRFSSLFSYAYLMSICGRLRLRAADGAGGIEDKMRGRIGGRSSGRSSKLTSRSWCYLQNPPGTHLRFLFISWWFLSGLPGIPGIPVRVEGAADETRLTRQPEYTGDWTRGISKGTDVLSQLSGIPPYRQKHGESPPGKTSDSFSVEISDRTESLGADSQPYQQNERVDSIGFEKTGLSVHFENGLSVPLPLFLDLETKGRPKSMSDSELSQETTIARGCCFESPEGNLALSFSEVSFVTETELLYAVVQIGREGQHWVHVSNPTEIPLHVQGFISSKTETSFRPNDGSDGSREDAGCSQGFLSESGEQSEDSQIRVFYFAEGAVDEAVVEPHGKSILGPVVFRPTRRCLSTGLLSVWNNLTNVEWVPLQGSGGSASLAFFDVGGYQTEDLMLDQNRTFHFGVLEPVLRHSLDVGLGNIGCSQRIEATLQTMNTGDIHLEVSSVELVGEIVQPTTLERAVLYLAIIALFVVLGVFSRMLVQEMSPTRVNVSSKSVSQPKAGGRQVAPLSFSQPHTVAVNKTSSSPAVSGRLKCSFGEPEVQSRTGDGTGASGPGRPKESLKGLGLVRALKGVADSFTAATIGSSTCSDESKAEVVAPSQTLPGLRVKIPNSGASNGSKSNLGSPMRDTPNSSSNHFRKGVTDKRGHVARSDGQQQGKVVPDALEGAALISGKMSPVSKPPNSVGSSPNLVFSKQGADAEQPLNTASTLPINSGVVTGAPMRSPRKGVQLNQPRQVFTPKAQSQPLSPKCVQQQSSPVLVEKDKSKRKKRRSNMGNVKNELASKGRSGSSSPLSSPASPATPASPSRPVSPLHHSELQSNLSALSPPGFSSKNSGDPALMSTILPLTKLDVSTERRSSANNSASKPGNKSIKDPASPVVYRRAGNLSVDVASTALKEMVQAKASDLTGTSLPGKGNVLAEKSSNGVIGKLGMAKDWATVARKASMETAVTSKDDNSADRRSRVSYHGNGNSTPALTPSATFPRKQDRCSGWNVLGSFDTEQEAIIPAGSSSPNLVPASTMPPAARAPGAKIAKTSFEVSGKDIVLGTSSECRPDGIPTWTEAPDKKAGSSLGFKSSIMTEDQRVYDIWGNHFVEISRSSPDRVASSMSVMESAPSFFSAFPETSYTPVDTSRLNPALSRVSSPVMSPAFSVFSQAPEIEHFSLPSAHFNSPRVPSRPSAFHESSLPTTNFGLARSTYKGLGLGNSLPGSPRKPRAPYSPPLGPGLSTVIVANEPTQAKIPELHTNEPSCSYWSGSILQ